MPVTVRSLGVRLLASATLAVFAAALPATSAGAAPKQGKQFEMVVESPEWAGVNDGAYTITITNRTGTQQLGSANLTIPSASPADADFTVTAEPSLDAAAVARGATIARPADGKLMELRNLALAPAPNPNSSVTITLGLRMPCVADVYRWIIDARQSNDFSGTPGNMLGPVSGTLDTTVEGSCKLRFVGDPETPSSRHPASAEVGDEITPDAFDPHSAKLVTVEAVDGSPDPQPLTWFEDTVELTAAGGPGSLSASSPASTGLATFDDLTIGLSGNYNLIASPASAPGFTDGESADFQIIDDVGHCTSASCNAHVQGEKSSSTLTGTGVTREGFALLSLNLGTKPVCADYTPPTTDWYEFQLTVDGDKTVQAFYSKDAMKRVAGPSSLQICFAAPIFFDAQGGAQPFDYDGNPLTDGNPNDRFPGAEGFVGLLPIGCPAVPAGPCVMSRSGTTGGGAIVTFFVPAAWGDPRYT